MTSRRARGFYVLARPVTVDRVTPTNARTAALGRHRDCQLPLEVRAPKTLGR
jgi:hypothetical protein